MVVGAAALHDSFVEISEIAVGFRRIMLDSWGIISRYSYRDLETCITYVS